MTADTTRPSSSLIAAETSTPGPGDHSMPVLMTSQRHDTTTSRSGISKPAADSHILLQTQADRYRPSYLQHGISTASRVPNEVVQGPMTELNVGATRRTNDPERTRQNILAVALEEFSAHGLSGARVDEIAARTRTTKRMIYYYFKDKQGLYLAVLERAYCEIRLAEEALETEFLAPAEAIRKIIDFTFDYHETHTQFVRLVGIENIHDATLLRLTGIGEATNVGILNRLRQILAEGLKLGVFQRHVDALDLHLLITSFCFYRIGNEHTFNLVFGLQLRAPQTREKHRTMIAESVLAYLRTE